MTGTRRTLLLMLGAALLLTHSPARADRTPDWMVGQFESDNRNGRVITIRIAPQGNMTATIVPNSERAVSIGAAYRRDLLTLDDRDYTVFKTGDGFRAVPNRDRPNQGNARNRDDNDRFAQIVFHRVNDAGDDRRSGERPPDWLQGRYEGLNPATGEMLTLMIDRQGEIAASSRLDRRSRAYTTSPYRQGVIGIDGTDYRVTRSRSGFSAVSLNGRRGDRSVTINFQRMGDFVDNREAARLPDWMVGTFEGTGRDLARPIVLRTNRQSVLSAEFRGGRRGSDRPNASWRRDTLTIDGVDYTTERTPEGFRATPVDSRDNPRTDRAGRAAQILFRRTGD